MVVGFTLASSMIASMRYILFDYYLSLVRTSIILRMLASAEAIQATRSLQYLDAYLRRRVELLSAREA